MVKMSGSFHAKCFEPGTEEVSGDGFFDHPDDFCPECGGEGGI